MVTIEKKNEAFLKIRAELSVHKEYLTTLHLRSLMQSFSKPKRDTSIGMEESVFTLLGLGNYL